MKYPGAQVRTWIITKLAGVAIGGVSVPVFNLKPRDTSAVPYLLVGSQTQGETQTKDGDCAYGTLLVQAVTKFTGDYGGELFADSVASEVSNRLTGADGSLTGFTVSVMDVNSNESNIMINEREKLIVRQLEFRLFVQES